MVFKLKEEIFRFRCRKNFFTQKVLEQVAQSSCGCLISGGIQAQVGWDPWQPDQVVGQPAIGWNWMISKVSSNLSCCMIL